MMVHKPLHPTYARAKVAVSERALAKFATLRKIERASSTQAIGLIQTASGLSLVLDVPDSSDRVISRDGVPIVFIAAELERRFRGCILDFAGPKGEERFSIERRLSEALRAPESSSDQTASVFTSLLRETSPENGDHDSQGATGDDAVNSIEVLESKGPDGYGFHFRVRTTGRVYRIEPARDPKQPRFWCFRIFRCLPSHMVDVTERAWHGEGGMTWADVPAAAEAIRADPNGWLEKQQFRQLRRWLLEEDD